MSKILCSFNDWNANTTRKKLNTWGGIGYYRAVKPSQQIFGHDVTLVGQELMGFGKNVGETWDKIFKEYDVFWTHYFHPGDDGRNASAMFYTARKYNKKIILDLDDNSFDVPESNLIYDKYKKGSNQRAFLNTVLYLADAITVSTEPLKQRVLQHFRDVAKHMKVEEPEKKVYVIPNYNDKKDWDVKEIEPDPRFFTIGYSGSTSHYDDLMMVMPSLIKILQKYEHVRIQFMGAVRKDLIKNYFKDVPASLRYRMDMVGSTETFNEYPEWLSQQQWNVGIAPLVDSPFTRCKSHIKWMEYASIGLPTVASRVYPYFMDIAGKKTIVDGETGFLVRNNQWVEVLSDLIEHPEKCKKIGKQAKEYVQKELQYDNSDICKVVNQMLNEI